MQLVMNPNALLWSNDLANCIHCVVVPAALNSSSGAFQAKCSPGIKVIKDYVLNNIGRALNSGKKRYLLQQARLLLQQALSACLPPAYSKLLTREPCSVQCSGLTCNTAVQVAVR